MRSIGGTRNDLFRFKLKQLSQRYMVLSGFKRDPYDTFKWIINKQKQKYFEPEYNHLGLENRAASQSAPETEKIQLRLNKLQDLHLCRSI